MESAQSLVSLWWPLVAMLVAAGTLAGILAGLLGIGGGLIIVPTLFFVLQSLGFDASVAMQVAVGTSLTTIVPTSISAAIAHHRRGNVDVALFRRWLVPMISGVVIGGWLAISAGGTFMTAVYGVIATLMALNLLLRSPTAVLVDGLPNPMIQALCAALIGFFCVMMGVGAGVMGVAVLTAFNQDMRRAVGTAALFGLVIAAPGATMMLFASGSLEAAPPWTFGSVNILGFLIIAPLTILTAPWGVKLGAMLTPMALRRVFAACLLVVGVRMLWQFVSL